MVGWLGADTDPATGPLAQIGGTGGFALDRDRRSVGAFLATPARINRLELTASGSTSTRLAEQDYTLWTSDDNITYQQLTGWSFQASTTDGHPVHTFTNLDTTTRYIKINTRYTDTAHTFVMTNRAADLAVYGTPDDPSQPDEGLTVTDRGVAYADPAGAAYRPAITRAPNGDILATFNTTSDVNPGGTINLIRSTDDGRTWGPAVVLKEASEWENGSIYSSRGMTTLSDGTILLPFNEGVNHSPFNNRESKLFVARSTDSGHTWEGLDTPIEMPVETREHWACCSRILELDDGSLLLPLWGTKDLVPDWEADPQRWRAALVKSYDGGRTWTDYSTIAYDPNNPARANGAWPDGFNEPSIAQLPDGRLVAMLRYESITPDLSSPDRFRVYVSHSSDRGATWSPVKVTSLLGATPSVAIAPCTNELGGEGTKLVFGYRDRSTIPGTSTLLNAPAVSVSFDEGLTWTGHMLLQPPDGGAPESSLGSEMDFLPLDGSRLLTLFQYRSADGGAYKLGYNVLQDATGGECRTQLEQARETAEKNLTLFVERGDRDDWPMRLAVGQLTFPPSTLVGEVVSAAADAVSCSSRDGAYVVDEEGRRLDATTSLTDAGVGHGDVLTVYSDDQANSHLTAGHAEQDGFPQTRHVYAWSDTCDYRLPLDSASRSLGLHVEIPDGQAIRSVSLRDTDDTSRLTSDNYTLWASQDNDDYHQITDWSLTTDVIDGRLVHTFTGLSVSEPYLKIHQSHATGTETFVIDSMRDDVDVSFDACPDGHSTETTIAFGAADSGVPNYDQGDGCTFLDQLWAQAPFADHATFVRAVRDLTVTWRTDDLLTRYETAQVLAAAARSGTPPQH
ncbi:exo-alpha-sialidase [Jiangella sp. DSM 45060]|uniref:exo-alpha-sialidase n=1 Tax=Jiangella sp. DSM 45060 TaxID=1798224 RepID=UPI000B894456|nr:exo-alpha-sialidase [Jiangella sp. DSM 45060]